MADQNLLKLLQLIKQAQSDSSRLLLAIGGAVAVGKSSFAKLIKDNLPDDNVEIVASDGFLYSNQELEGKGIFDRKGFPESYDKQEFIDFLKAAKAGLPISYPIYSQDLSDIESTKNGDVDISVDIVIVEGINVLSLDYVKYFDLKWYLQANISNIESWYLERSLQNIHHSADKPNSWYQQFSNLPDDQLTKLALDVWQKVNLVNIIENIEPTKKNADLLVKIDGNHEVLGLQ